MEASKLLNVISDLVIESKDNEIGTLFSNLISHISTNQESLIIEAEKSLKEVMERSLVNSYSPSNIEILTKIGGLSYFGSSGLSHIRSILTSNGYNVAKTITDLQEYNKQRQAFLDVLVAAKESLTILNIETYYHDENIYEIGLLLPAEVTDNKIIHVSRELVKWDKIIKTLKELFGEEIDDTQISLVSNGSLQFFIDNSPAIGTCLAIIIDRILKVYKNLILIRQSRDQLKELGISAIEQKAIERHEKDYLNKEIDKISLEIVKEFASKAIESGRMNELKISVRGHIAYIAKSINSGITIEITPPEYKEPEILQQEETKDNKAEQKKVRTEYEKILRQVEIVNKSMETFREIGKIGSDVMKYLDSSDESKDELNDDLK